MGKVKIKKQKPKAEEIAKRDLASILRAANVEQMQDTEELHMKPMIVSVVIKPASGSFDESNDIRAYKGAAVEYQLKREHLLLQASREETVGLIAEKTLARIDEAIKSARPASAGRAHPQNLDHRAQCEAELFWSFQWADSAGAPARLASVCTRRT